MGKEGASQRDRRIRIGMLVVLAALFLAGSTCIIFALRKGEKFSGFLLNLGTELLGALVTFVLIDRLVGGMDQERDRRRELILSIYTGDRERRDAALATLMSNCWLQGASLTRAPLSKALLESADLRGVDLTFAVLMGAELSNSRMDDAILHDADMRGAILKGASLKNARLIGTDFTGAILDGADMSGALILNTKGLPNDPKSPN